jgi:hypothetical protein
MLVIMPIILFMDAGQKQNHLSNKIKRHGSDIRRTLCKLLNEPIEEILISRKSGVKNEYISQKS